MKLKFLFISLSFLTFFLGFLFPKTALADTFTLSGRVSDNANNSIVGATIDVIDRSNNITVASAITDLGGNYITIVNGGTYSIQVIPPAGSNFSPAIALGQNVSVNKVLNFILVPSGTVTLSGHIYDPFGTPLADQKLSIGSIDSITDINGNYSLQVTPGTHQISIISKIPNNDLSLKTPQMYNVAFSYPVNQSIADLDITLPAKKVDIHVQDATSAPVQNVEIRTTRASSSVNLSVGGTTVNANVYSAVGLNISGGQIPGPTTDQFGNATFWLFNGLFNITAIPPSGSGYLSKTVSNFNVSSDTQGTIELLQPVTLSGHIYDPFGTPLADQKLSIGSIDSITDINGNYSLQVTPGTHQISIISKIPNNDLSLKVSQLYSLAFSYSIIQNTTLDITIPAKKVDIHVQNASNNPVRDVEIRTSRTSTSVVLPINGGTSAGGYSAYGLSIFGSPVTGPKTDDSGNVTLWLLSGSPFTITATPPSGSYLQTTLSDLAISSDKQITMILEDQPVTLSGHIYDYLGNPLANQKVQLSATGLSTVDAFTDAEGSYSMQATPHAYNIQIAANNSLTVNAPQMYNTSFDYQLTQNTVLDITIPAKKVDVHVQDASNSPVSDVEISTSRGLGSVSILVGGVNINASVYSAAGLNLSGISVPGPKTDESGNATLILLPGEFTMNANPPSGSIYSSFTLNNVVITNNETEIISLQYNHATPITTIDLQTQDPDQTYSEPTTVTLSATAAEGYTIANTYYKVDGGFQQTYKASFTVSGNGQHSVEYWSVDNSGVQETHKTKTFTIYQNQAPHVNPLSGSSINLGATYIENDSFSDSDSSSWTGTVDYGEGAGPVSLSLNSDKTFSLNHQYATAGTYTVTVVVTDGEGATGTTLASVRVNAPPQITGLNDTSINYQDDFIESGSFTDIDSASWTGTVDYGFGGGPQPLTLNPDKTFTLDYPYAATGIYTVTVKITDNQGATGTASITVTVNAPPHINELLGATINEGQAYTEEGSFADTDSITWTATVDYGDVSGVRPLPFNPDNTFSLSNVYSDNGTYAVTVRITDNQGATATKSTTVTVNNVAPTVSTITASVNPIQINTSTTATATFSDAGVRDTHTAVWDWGDGTTSNPATLTESNGSGSVSDSHTYTTSGVYEITLTVTDKDGGVGTQTFRYLSVYSPTPQGLFSAGQKYTSPAGAYYENPNVAGNVMFGLSYKYQGDVPVGNRQFTMDFKTANFEFNAANISSFVISNGVGTLRGTGTITNRSGEYGFLVVGKEGTDTIRIKITDPSNSNAVIYDTQPGASDTSTPTTAVTAGNVLAH